MPKPINAKLRTCRYWALGPCCPNFDRYGVDVCAFAHWDTGILASHLEQRGSCLSYMRQGYCPRGANCFFEHRNTGVTGPYQGGIDLTGFELAVADAAFKSGFNTYDHVALYELIWSVKRIALNVVRPDAPPPPHPIYPDRYRPSGVGDNTMKKRRKVTARVRYFNREPPKFNSVPPLMRKRKTEDGTMNNPILLDADTDTGNTHGPPANSGAKRQKKFDQPYFESDPETKQVPYDKPVSHKDHFASNESFIKISSPTPISMKIPRSNVSANAQIAKQLQLVKTKLADIRNATDNTQNCLKAMFDKHMEMMDQPDIRPTLDDLANCLHMIFNGSRDGTIQVDKVLDWLYDVEKGIL